jgi:hypothetical protein
MTETTTTSGPEFVLAPTVLVRLEADAYGVVTVGSGEDEALLVFRGRDDARAYQRTSGKHTEAEGFEVLGLTDKALAAMLEKHGLSWVCLPGPWTGDSYGGSDLFAGEDFLRLLAELPPASRDGEGRTS